MSKINRPPVSIAKIARQMKKSGREGKIIVIVGTVTNDERIFDCPKIKVGLLTAVNSTASKFAYLMLLMMILTCRRAV